MMPATFCGLNEMLWMKAFSKGKCSLLAHQMALRKLCGGNRFCFAWIIWYRGDLDLDYGVGFGIQIKVKAMNSLPILSC